MKKWCLYTLILWCLLIVIPSVIWYTCLPNNIHKYPTEVPPDLYSLLPNSTIEITENLTQNKALFSEREHPLLHFCNLPGKNRTHSSEGHFQEGYILIGVITVFRHGDRGLLTQLKSKAKINCSSHIIDLYKKFENSVRSYGSKSIIEKIIPTSDFCHQGLLSKQGSSQLLELGQVLRDSYANHLDFLNSSDFSNINAFTTPYSRTIQSMHSLLFGMLGPTSLLRVKIQSRSQVPFCFKHCHCPITDRLEKLHKKELIERVSRDSFFRNFSLQIRPLQREMEKPSTVELPSTIRDIALVYVCHNLTFPWFDAHKSQLNSFRSETLVEALEREAHTSSSGINLRKAAALRCYGLLTYINQKIESWISKRKNPDNIKRTRPKLIFFSGHDLTLMYILATLGVYDGYLPRYASRITFEILQRRGNHYVRILWDGNEKTSTICAQKTGLYCEANFLKRLLESLLMSYFGTFNFWEACGM